jgi:hypothetical protein
MTPYILRVLVALDRLVMVIVGGKLEETLSAAAYVGEQRGLIFGRIFRPVIDALFFFDPSHCYNQYIYEKSKYEHYKDASSNP